MKQWRRRTSIDKYVVSRWRRFIALILVIIRYAAVFNGASHGDVTVDTVVSLSYSQA